MAVKGTMLAVTVTWYDLERVKLLIGQAEELLSTTVPLPENRTDRCLDLLTRARELAESLKHPPLSH